MKRNKFEKSLLRSILNEKYLGEAEEPKMTSVDRRSFLEAVANYHKLGEMIYSSTKLKEVTETLRSVCERAEKLTVTESEHWFDNVTVSRHMKQMNEAMKIFEKTAGEMGGLQQRLESAYEDMGTVLNRYYKVNSALSEDHEEAHEVEEDLNISAKANKKMDKYKLSNINIEEADGEGGSQTWTGHEKHPGKSLKSKTWQPAGKSLKKDTTEESSTSRHPGRAFRR